MATLLSIPYELREQILEEAISIYDPFTRGRPFSGDRKQMQDEYSTPEQQPVIFLDPTWRSGNTEASLSLVNHQLRAETQRLLRRRNKEPYCLQVIYIDEFGLLPTWTKFLGRRQVVDTVEIAIRFFRHYMKPYASKFFARRQQAPPQTDDMLDRDIIVLLTHLVLPSLNSYSLSWDMKTLHEPSLAFVKSITIYVQGQGMKQGLVERLAANPNALSFNAWCRARQRSTDRPKLDGINPRIGAAQGLATEVKNTILRTLAMEDILSESARERDGEGVVIPALYSRLLYCHIGVVNVVVSDYDWEHIDIGECFRERYKNKLQDNSQADDLRSWVMETASLRRQYGLDDAEP